MGHRIVLFDVEDVFVKGLCAYLNDRYQAYFESMAFDDADKLLNYLKGNECRMCFVSKAKLDAYQMEQLLGFDIPLVWFCTLRQEEGIFQFQPVSRIAKEILDRYLEAYADDCMPQHCQNQNRKADIIGFYSPQRSNWQSMTAIAFGQQLAAKRKTLYLNFEPFSGFSYLLQKKFSHDLSDLLFYLKEDEGKLLLRLQSILEKTGELWYIPPAASFPDIRETGLKTWKTLLYFLMYQTDMEVLILDFSEQVDGLFELLSMCDVICMGSEDHFLWQAKKEEYLHLVQGLKKEDILSKTVEYHIPTVRQTGRISGLLRCEEIRKIAESLLQKLEEKKEEDQPVVR